MRTALSIALLVTAVGCTPAPPVSEPSAAIVEASGVAYHDGELLIVDDSAAGSYFRVPFAADTPPGTLTVLNDATPVKVELPTVGPWIDLEGIDVLVDGRIVVLSERLHSLVGDEGVIVEYDYQLGELGRRGLEGIAVEAAPDGSSRIAVLWEGGYPDPESLNVELEERGGGAPYRPVIFVHDLAPGEVIEGRLPWSAALRTITLDVPLPEGAEPEAQRFRAPELVWYAIDSRPGFIVLLSSQNRGTKRAYLHHWLQRFDFNGAPVGEPLDIAKAAPPEIGDANWEGLSWLDYGNTLVLVHEGFGSLPAHAFVMELPPDWR